MLVWSGWRKVGIPTVKSYLDSSTPKFLLLLFFLLLLVYTKSEELSHLRDKPLPQRRFFAVVVPLTQKYFFFVNDGDWRFRLVVAEERKDSNFIWKKKRFDKLVNTLMKKRGRDTRALAYVENNA